jgi:hypothetical protein
MMASGQQRVVYPVDSKQLLQEEEEENGENLRDTKDAFYQYVFAKASRDRQLSRNEVDTLREVKVELETCEETHTSGEAAEMGRRLAEIGEPAKTTPSKLFGWGALFGMTRCFVGIVHTVLSWLRCLDC